MTNIRFKTTILLVMILCISAFVSGCTDSSTSQSITNQEESTTSTDTVTITDAMGREVEIPDTIENVICSGAGSLRLLTYLESEDKIIAVDSIEARENLYDARPYALANPQFATDYTVFGEFRGNDDPEKILALEPQPDVILKTYSASGYDPVELQEKTGIPVVVVNYGNMVDSREDMYQALRIYGEVMDKEERAEEVIEFFDETIADINERTSDVSDDEKTSCYVGGIARAGPHGLQSTEPTYPPFFFTNALNVAYDDMDLSTAEVAKEKIIEWDPEILFVDLSTMQSEDENSAVYQLQNDDSYQQLQAVSSGNVYGMLPYNWYTQNFGSVLADSYYAGKLLYPENFEDVDIEDKTAEIYTFLVCDGDEELGEEVADKMINAFGTPAFTRLDV
ncbi:iron ABC transporter substrate-binding protein [Methanolobus vulcani]|uniref:Iron ABC transporter substrate-binding protein n=1 Tax=Methanolobus vulcani TaxID=38026 RepID=A0A7Z8KLP2_9EURY|nr:iron ABC transporter substrate-binding protein [Methanolobus vulcani]TQD23830.1 iron ABC transporter substrate-binding protein [Methanolobus vulcani]